MQKHDGNIFESYVLFHLSNELKKNNKMGGVVKYLIVFFFCNKFIKFNSQNKSMLSHSADLGSPSVMQHIVSVESSSLLLYSYFT